MFFVLIGLPIGVSMPILTGSGNTGISAPVNTVAPNLQIIENNFISSRGSWSNSPNGYIYSWYLDGVITGGQTGSGLALSSLPENSEVYCRVGAFNAGGTGYANSNSLQVPFREPVNSVAPTISSGANQYYVSSTGVWSGQYSGVQYQWFVDSSLYNGQTGTGLLYSLLSNNNEIYCRVSLYNEDATGSANSNSLIYLIEEGSAPENTVAPAIQLNNGIYSLSSTGNWSNSPTGFGYAWTSGSNVIIGATGTSLVGTGYNPGVNINIIVSGFNQYGTGTGISNTMTIPYFEQIYWSDESDNEDGFRIEWGSDTGNFNNTGYAAIDSTGYLVPFDTTGVYYVRVWSYNEIAGSTGVSDIIQVTAS